MVVFPHEQGKLGNEATLYDPDAEIELIIISFISSKININACKTS